MLNNRVNFTASSKYNERIRFIFEFSIGFFLLTHGGRAYFSRVYPLEVGPTLIESSLSSIVSYLR